MTAMSIFGFDKVSTDCLACPDGMPLVYGAIWVGVSFPQKMFYVTQYSGLNEQSADPSSVYPIPMPSLLVILALP